MSRLKLCVHTVNHDERVQHRKIEVHTVVYLSIKQILEEQQCRTAAPERKVWLREGMYSVEDSLETWQIAFNLRDHDPERDTAKKQECTVKKNEIMCRAVINELHLVVRGSSYRI